MPLSKFVGQTKQELAIDKKGLRHCAKLQDLGGGDCDYCDCDCCYGGKVKSHPTS